MAPSAKPKATSSVLKAVQLLEMVGAAEVASVQALSRRSGMPKATVARLLGTLVKCGFVQQLSRRSGYCLKSPLADVAAGYFGVPAILEFGAPIVTALTKQILWPAAIATYESGAMVVRYSTIPISPYAHVASTINKRLSLAERAHGRAYLAFCRRNERNKLFETVPTLRGMQRSERRQFLKALKSIRLAGYATRPSDVDPDTSTIAVPIFLSGQVNATIGVTFFKSVVPSLDQRPLARLVIAAARNIQQQLEGIFDQKPLNRHFKPGK